MQWRRNEPKRLVVENYKQLGRCYDELGMKEKADDCWKESGFPRVRMASPGRRPSVNSRSSRR